MKVINNADMAKFTSFKAGGKAKELIVAESENDLINALNSLGEREYIILGNGTNILFACEEYQGLVIKLGEAFDFLEIDGKEDGAMVRAGAGTLLSTVSKAAGSDGYKGLEFAAGIPGSIGGAVFMNAGAYDGEIKDVLKSARVLKREGDSWEVCEMTNEELELSYRHSKLMEVEAVILDATFELEKGDKEEIAAKMKDFSNRRTSKQPLEYPSAGSFFKRPEGYFAGKLIQDAGLAGFTVGGAQVSEKHCGFVINKGGATYQDILELKDQVQKKVLEEFGVKLEPELRIITE